jgi:hypothetical protein
MRARTIIALGLAGFGLTACSGNSAEVGRCVTNGEPREACVCMADASRKNLEPELYRVVQLGGQGKDAEAQAAYDALPTESQLKFTAVNKAVREACQDKGARPFGGGPAVPPAPPSRPAGG